MKTPKLKESGIRFEEEEHRYFMPDGKELSGITSTLVKWLFPDTYKNIPKKVLDEAAQHGSYVHKCIEMTRFVGATEACPESREFLDLMEQYEMSVVEHEYIVSDFKTFASAIDIVLMDKDGGIWLVDIKTTSSLNKPKVVAQLSIYALWFEQMNPTLKVKGIIELWLPREQYRSSSYEPWQILQRVGSEEISAMIERYCAKESNEESLTLFLHTDNNSLPAKYYSLIEAIAEQERATKEIASQTAKMKEALLKAFRENKVKKIDIPDVILMTYVEPGKKKGVDTDKLKKQYPDVYAECIKETATKDSIRITIR